MDGYFVNFHTILECGELDFPVELTIVYTEEAGRGKISFKKLVEDFMMTLYLSIFYLWTLVISMIFK